MTKILTRKCSVPAQSADVKQARCEFNILYALQMDIELYNYTEVLLSDYRAGKLGIVKGKGRLSKEEIEAEEKGTGINAGVSFLPMSAQPSGVIFKRDNADFMNNFFIDITCRSFTNIEELHR